MPEGFRNQLYYGDNLEWLKKLPDEIADLIYLDPPFNSNRNYNLLFKQQEGEPSAAQIMAFEDTWQWDPLEYDKFKSDPDNERLFKLVTSLYDILGDSEMMAYVVMMAPRLLQLHKKLKSTGSLYLHCDPAASHYLKIILDVVFEPLHFKNEVIWKRTSAHSSAKRWGPVHDVVLFYSKSKEFTWNPQHTAFTQEYVDMFFDTLDEKGKRYKRMDLTGDGTRNGPSGDPWRGLDVRAKGRHWAYLPATLENFDEEGLLHWPKKKGGMPRLKQYPEDLPGVAIQDVIADVRPIHNLAEERRGYPTQKPLALLERIIAASSNEGDVVLDPFAGCGTAIVAAERMGRKWIGIDITYLAINEIIDRLRTEKVMDKDLEYSLEGTPKDLHDAQKLFEDTAHQNHQPFEQWCCSLVGARWNEKKGADKGIDGRIGLWMPDGSFREALVQVKGGNQPTLSQVRDFANVIESNEAVLGLMVSLKKPTKEMKLVMDKMGYADLPTQKKYKRFQWCTIEELVEKGIKPEMPDSYRVPSPTGVGKVKAVQPAMDLDP